MGMGLFERMAVMGGVIPPPPKVHKLTRHSQECHTPVSGREYPHGVTLHWAQCSCGWFSTPSPYVFAANIAEGLHWEQAQLDETRRTEHTPECNKNQGPNGFAVECDCGSTP